MGNYGPKNQADRPLVERSQHEELAADRAAASITCTPPSPSPSRSPRHPLPRRQPRVPVSHLPSLSSSSSHPRAPAPPRFSPHVPPRVTGQWLLGDARLGTVASHACTRAALELHVVRPRAGRPGSQNAPHAHMHPRAGEIGFAIEPALRRDHRRRGRGGGVRVPAGHSCPPR